MSKTKRNALLLLSIAGLLTLILAMSLSRLTLSSGEPFSLGKTDVTMPGVTESVPGGEELLWLVRGVVALVAVFIPIYIIFSLFSAQGRQRLLVDIIIVLLLLWFLDYLDKHPGGEQADRQEAMTVNDLDESADGPPPAVFSASEAPGWLAPVIILAASLFGAGLLAAIVWYFQRSAARISHPLHSLAETAQDTIESLRSGGDFKTAIIRCYYEMNQVIKQERGISREIATTPREFETYLVSRGLPQDALETLTRLFEQARYGSAPPKTDDEALAVSCLTRIVDACKAAKIRP